MYADHLQNWLDYAYVLLMFVILVLFWLSEPGQIWVSRHLLENPLRKWPDIWHADVSWSPSGLIRFWSQFVDFFSFWCYFDLVKQVKFGVSGHFGYALWMFLIIISPFTETGHIWGFWVLSGEHVVVNVKGKRRHISDVFRRVLSSASWFEISIRNMSQFHVSMAIK